jgi:hypothetical protein
MYGLVLASALAGLSPAAAPPHGPVWVLEVGLTSDQVSARTEGLRLQGYRPVCISAYNAVEANRFAVVYQKDRGNAWQMDWGLTAEQFPRRARNLLAKGYVPVCLSGCNSIGACRLSDLWVKQKAPVREMEYNIDAAGLLRQVLRMKERGYHPMSLSSYMVNAASVYAIIWEKRASVNWELKYGLSAQDLQDALDDLSALGYRPVSISGHNDGGVVRYGAVWHKRKGSAWMVRYGQSQETLLSFARSMATRGYHPVQVAGCNTVAGDRFASIWEKD